VGCKQNVADEHPQVVARLTELAEQARRDLGDRGQQGRGQRPAGHVAHPRPQTMSRKGTDRDALSLDSAHVMLGTN
ncbi:MAG: hypothetical protein ACC645_08970, partial [Pirellulales bacterium]